MHEKVQYARLEWEDNMQPIWENQPPATQEKEVTSSGQGCCRSQKVIQSEANSSAVASTPRPDMQKMQLVPQSQEKITYWVQFPEPQEEAGILEVFALQTKESLKS